MTILLRVHKYPKLLLQYKSSAGVSYSIKSYDTRDLLFMMPTQSFLKVNPFLQKESASSDRGHSWSNLSERRFELIELNGLNELNAQFELLTTY